jgi:hypothetical protein
MSELLNLDLVLALDLVLDLGLKGANPQALKARLAWGATRLARSPIKAVKSAADYFFLTGGKSVQAS